jgi:bifunctional DNA-binding transcriptional regulator/antitoxin component of YhaV-PrlF toxin-antitoxin module
MSVIAHSKLTAQGRVSVPAAVRRRLGVGVHRALFPKSAPKAKTLDQLKEGIRRSIRTRSSDHP